MEDTHESCKMEGGAGCGCGSMSSHEHCGCDQMASHGHHGCGDGHHSHSVTRMYKRAYMDALYQAQVERLRKRIDAKFGSTLDKMADAVAESFGKMWESKMAKMEARQELEAKLRKILSETTKT
ncbi:MAG: hypothetical protein WAN47_02380 [Nitrosotalea sp.]